MKNKFFNMYRSIKNRNFCINSRYICNFHPKYYLDIPNTFFFQQDAYDLAYYIATRSDAKYIIDIGGGNGLKLKKFVGEFEIITIDFGDNLIEIEKNLYGCKVICFDLENGLPEIPEYIVDDAIIIFSDVIEHIINPNKVLKNLSQISYKCKFLIITTPDRTRARGISDFGPPSNQCHVREWCIEEFYSLLLKYNFCTSMIGYTTNTNYHLCKNNLIAISGKHCNVTKMNGKKILAIINMYNESDIIKEVIQNLLNQDVDIKIVDNWSNDGSYEIVEEISKAEIRVSVERYPINKSEYYEWKDLLKHTEDLAYSCDYDWIIHHDADEIRLSPWKGITLSKAIAFVDSLGYNAIDFTVLDFKPTEDENSVDEFIQNRLRFYEFGSRPGHFIQIKAWKKTNTRVDLASSGGHEAKFNERKVYPIKFLIKHYPIRSQEHARKKIFIDRIARFLKEERDLGWHTQYDSYKLNDQFVWDKNDLYCWNENFFATEFLVERISGIGINR